MSILEPILSPFTDYAFMGRALIACLLLCLSGTPLGVFLVLRRMTLVGDAMTHGILPGIAVAYLVAGLSLWAMTLGGLVAALLMAFLAHFLTRFTRLKEDAAFSFLYLFSLAIGIALLSLKGSAVDLVHFLFGNILAINHEALYLITGTSLLSVLLLVTFYRRFALSCFDPDFLKVQDKGRDWTSPVFFALLMINLVAAFQALGTLMALGLMILPPLAARFWTRTITGLIPLSVLLGMIASVTGLLISYHTAIPAGPAIVMTAGTLGVLSLIVGRYDSLWAYYSRT